MYDILYPFHFPEVRRMQEDTFAIRGDDFSEGIDGLAVKPAGVYKIVDDPDIFFNLECPVGLFAEITGNRRNSIALVDGKGYHRRKGLVPPYQGDIGSVQRS